MQIILLLIEIFMPEIAAQLATGKGLSVRKKLQRAGLGLVIVACIIATISVYLHVVLHGLPLTQIDLLTGGPLTAVMLLIVGVSLLMAADSTAIANSSESDSQEMSEATVDRAVEINRPDGEIWSAYLDARKQPSAERLVKLKTIHLSDCAKGVMPSEAWIFFTCGHAFLVVHKVETGSQLWMDDMPVDHNAEKMHFGIKKNPCLRASIKEAGAEIVVYFRAHLHIRIKVSLNGNWLNDEFV